MFFQLKAIFHTLESLGSARIEGNHTTLADYFDNKIEGKATDSDQLREIANIEKAMSYIEEIMRPGEPLTERTIREIHAMTVEELEREGDRTPGPTVKLQYVSRSQITFRLKLFRYRATCKNWWRS